MSKRRVADTLTGGTRDVNPQLLSGTVVQTANDVTTDKMIPLPINRFGGNSADFVTIIEVLKIWVDLPLLPASAIAGARLVQLTVATRNPTGAALDFEDPTVIMIGGWRYDQAVASAVGITQIFMPKPMEFDMTDGAGHGVLIGVDALWFQTRSQGTGLTNACDFKVLYRFKTVSLAEYIGIVQSQQ